MPTHAERKVLRYTPEQLFDMVADVRRYAGELAGADAALALYGPVERAPTLEEIRKRLAA